MVYQFRLEVTFSFLSHFKVRYGAGILVVCIFKWLLDVVVVSLVYGHSSDVCEVTDLDVSERKLLSRTLYERRSFVFAKIARNEPGLSTLLEPLAMLCLEFFKRIAFQDLLE